MRKFLFLTASLMAVVLLSACGPKPSRNAKEIRFEPVVENEPAKAASAGAPAAQRANSARSGDEEEEGASTDVPEFNPAADLDNLNAFLGDFVIENNRMPKDFAELVESGLEAVPTAPKGMKFTIDPVSKKVILVR